MKKKTLSLDDFSRLMCRVSTEWRSDTRKALSKIPRDDRRCLLAIMADEVCWLLEQSLKAAP